MSFGIPVRNGLAIGLLSSTMLSSRAGMSAALMLNFLTGSLDPRITFSRGSQATLTDSTGKITFAPNNLLTNSESFEAATWNKANASVSANASVAPDGTTTADVMTSSAAAGYIYPATNLFSAAGGGSFIASVYAKAGTATSFQILLAGVANYTGTFNLSTGVASTSTANTSVLMTAVGNGWYRCAMVCTSVASIGYAELQIGRIASTLTLNLWGAQLEQVTYQTTPGTYNSTTPKNLLGYTQEFDNAAWTKSNATVVPNQDPAVATLGSELVTNGDFSGGTTTGWTAASSATLSVVSGAMVVTNGATAFGYAYQAIATVPGKNYNVTFSVTGGTLSGNLYIGTTPGGFENYASPNRSVGTYTVYFTATAATTYLRVGAAANTSGGTVSFDNISAKELIGGFIVAPDGSTTADKLVANTTAAVHCVQQNATTAAPVAVSFYAKAAEYANAAVGSNANNYVYFDLTNGVVSSTLGTGWSSATITAVGNGWYRCAAFTSVSNTRYDIFAVNAVGTNGNTAPSYTGDGTSGIYVWGAQLSNSASLDPYVYNPGAAPTSAAYYGPRFDYDPVTLAAKGLLIEEQRTNVALYSEAYDNAAWSKSNTTITANATLSPDGTVNADAVIADTANTLHYVSSSFGSAITTYTLSFFAKSAGYRLVVFTNNGGTNMARGFDLSNGTTFTNTSGYSEPLSYAIVPVGNGWYRCSITFNKTAATSCGYGVWLNNGSADTFAGNGTSGVYIWGAQLEAGAFATSYIPTVASQVTRSADVALMQGANFLNWYNQNAGTISVQGDIIGYTLNQMIVSFTDGTITNPVQVYNDVSGQIQANAWVGGSVFVSYTQNSSYKYALGLENNNVGASINGGAVVSDLSVGPPVAYNRLNIGSRNGSLVLNGHIRNITYYNYRMPNALLQRITV